MTLRQTKWIVEMFQRHQHDYGMIDGCFYKNFEVHIIRSFSKQKKLMSRKQKLSYFDDVQ